MYNAKCVRFFMFKPQNIFFVDILIKLIVLVFECINLKKLNVCVCIRD